MSLKKQQHILDQNFWPSSPLNTFKLLVFISFSSLGWLQKNLRISKRPTENKFQKLQCKEQRACLTQINMQLLDCSDMEGKKPQCLKKLV